MKRLLLTLVGAAAGAALLLWPRRRNLPEMSSDRSPAQLPFPSGFFFGASTAAHQVEGGNENNNWARWEASTHADGSPTIHHGQRSARAADHWRRFDEDLERMKYLGLDMYRFSVEWSRIEPEEGRFDEQAMERYRTWCLKLRDAGIAPMVTLHHFTEPLWVTDRGGFEDPATVASFSRFVEHVVPRLADLVDHWITVNEPTVYAVMGWGVGDFPPGKKEPQRVAQVLEHLLLAHAEAYHLVHELDTVDADGDGVACMAAPTSNLVCFEPAVAHSPLDRYLARLLDRNYNRGVLHALETGRLSLHLPGMLELDVHHPSLQGTWDFAAVNHYFRYLTGLRVLLRRASFVGFDPHAEKNDLGWDLTPESLYDALRLAGSFGKPVFITENGVSDGDLPDVRRRAYLRGALGSVSRAIRDGVDVRAYLHWSLMDNFEWAHGYQARFGLYHVDYDTQERMLTSGAKLYREVILANREAKPR